MPHCNDFSETDLARRGLLDAPVSRRRLLQTGLATTLSMYAAQALPLTHALDAAKADAAVNPNAPVFVSIFVPGGLDLLDTLIPTGSYGRYADLRPTIKVDAPIELGTTGFGVHPSLGLGVDGGIKGLYDRGRIGFIPGIDYANPDLSHFNSRHFWESGLVNMRPSSGWLARWIDRNGNPDNPFQGLSSEYGLSPLLRGSSKPVAAVSSPEDAQAWIPGVWGEWEDRYNAHYERLAARRGRGPGPQAVFGAARQSRYVARTLEPYLPDSKTNADPLAPGVAYPTAADGSAAERFGGRLSHLAAMISLPLGIRVATAEAPGDFDTHDGQKAGLTNDLGALSKCLSSFQADLEARGVANRVLTLVWTEFGRRPKENSSGGSDHGAGGIAWVMGTRARAGMLTPYPDLNAFDRQDNLGVTVDFRSVYSSVLEQWLGTGAGSVLPDAGAVGRVALVA
ncbi:MAG TPA: DUF1501 domain-containing protein [Baekduia sp.]|nr:DUF1501 domain-containing protein [Baekduia sp.]